MLYDDACCRLSLFYIVLFCITSLDNLCDFFTCFVNMLRSICFFKQKTADEWRVSDWSSDVCSSDLNDGWYPEPDNLLRQDAYSLVNARVSFNFNDHASMSVWGRNLTNKFYYTILTANSLASVGSPEAPRTYGITLETKF